MVKIDEEFKSLIPSLTDEEYHKLEEKLLKEGCRDAIITWNDTIIDGHNRYEICNRHNIGYQTIPINVELFDKDEVKMWIIDHQLSRRNINPYVRSRLGLLYEEIFERKAKAHLKTNKGNMDLSGELSKEPLQNSAKALSDNEISTPDDFTPINTREEIAKIARVSRDTINKVKKIQQKASSDIKDKLEKGKISINKAYNEAIIIEENATPKEKEELENGKKSPNEVIKSINKRKKEEERIRKKEETQKMSDKLSSLSSNSEFKVELGKWYKLGNHLLYCGDSSSERFKSKISKVDFVFADPPYNAEVADWDKNFEWDHDWLIEKSPIVAVTPGIVSIQQFFKKTQMPYAWSVANWIDNGMTRGALGFGNWIYIALFSKEKLYRNSQDIVRCSVDISETDETDHKGRKPNALLEWLFDRFTSNNSTVLDPFMGSGTTLLVASVHKHNLKCIGAEINPEFCSNIISRWELLSGKKASIL